MRFLLVLLSLSFSSCGSLVDVKYVNQANDLCKDDFGLNYMRNKQEYFEVNCVNKKVYYIKKDTV